MTTEEMASEFSTVSGRQAITELVHCLNEACSKDPSFATAAATDAVYAFESLVRTHTDAREDHITAAYQLFSAAVFNAMTDVQVEITYWRDERS